MATLLRWLVRIAYSSAALCLAFVAFTLAEQSYYRAAARTLAASVRAPANDQSPSFELPGDTAMSADASLVGVPPNTAAVVAAAPGLLGELKVPQLRIATAIMEGDDATALRRGAGHLRSSALPGDRGNVVLAGHRDTVFRRLGELQRGDRLRLTTVRGVFDYRVSRTLRVRPNDTWVLDPSAAALTLITCYPFDWIGAAPERWIVQAEPLLTQASGVDTDR
jgi:LPXTG-site transpeptidase (sortase) family protein